MKHLSIWVPSVPITQGSKTAFAYKSKYSDSWRANIVDVNPKALKAWRESITIYARKKLGPAVMIEKGNPVDVHLAFYLPRPRHHFGTGRNAGVLKDSAVDLKPCLAKDDLDKLTRAALDALTGTAYADDGQVSDMSLKKRYATRQAALGGSSEGEPGVNIMVQPA